MTVAALPHNLEAEQALLGAILVNNEAAHRVSGFLLPEHFYEGVHERIYEATAELIRCGRKADLVTLRTRFEQDSALAEIGGPAYLARLAAGQRPSSTPRNMAALSTRWRRGARPSRHAKPP